jgi:acetyl-CoA carboxylase carboxyltransferase component
MSWEKEAGEIRRRREAARGMGGAEALQRQREKGRLNVRERVDLLLDAGSFAEHGPSAGAAEPDGGFTPANYVLGFGRIDGRPCVVGGEDFTVRGGSPNPAGLRKSVYAEELAVHYRVPLVRLHEGGGGSVAGAAGKGAGGPIGESVNHRPRFQSVAEALATVPVASAALGPVAGLPAARLVASHFSVMTRLTAQILVAGPAVVERALGTAISKEALGGAEVHGRNGTVDNVAADEPAALAEIRRFLSYLPQNVWELAPTLATDDPADRREEFLLSAVPRERRRPFDMRKVLAAVLDKGSFFEVGRGYGPGQITGLARLAGRSVGVIGNDCRFYAGAMTAAGARKVRRLIELCDTFHLPVLSFVDEPGFMIGAEAEAEATIRYGTAAVLAAAECTAPWASVMVRKSYGVAQAAHFGPDAYVLAWPSVESGALPVEGGVAAAFGREIARAPDPEARRAELEREMSARLSPFPRDEAFAVHALIDPRDTRPMLAEWLGWTDGVLQRLKGPRRFGYRP